MRNLNLTDDDLWRAIVDNTDALSTLIEKQSERDAGLGSSDPDMRQELLLFNVQAIKYHREYKEYVAEVRRRYASI